jgi:RimJ/RimL family protein N-acetyltransferase
VSRLPGELLTPRLLLRAPRPEDAGAVFEAVRESFVELNRWMPWAASTPTPDDARDFCARSAVQRQEETACNLLMIDQATGVLVGATGYPRLDWNVPSFEIGYWCRASQVGRGYVSESTSALADHAFRALGAHRVELRMDDRNERSFAVAERLGFALEGVLRNHVRDHHGALRDTRVYALVSGAGSRGSSASPADQAV